MKRLLIAVILWIAKKAFHGTEYMITKSKDATVAGVGLTMTATKAAAKSAVRPLMWMVYLVESAMKPFETIEAPSHEEALNIARKRKLPFWRVDPLPFYGMPVTAKQPPTEIEIATRLDVPQA